MNPPLSMEEALAVFKYNADRHGVRLDETNQATVTKAVYGVLEVVRGLEALGYQVVRPGLVVLASHLPGDDEP